MTRHDVLLAAQARACDEVPPREWSVAADLGLVQGPLDLAFFALQPLALTLLPGQAALLDRPGRPAQLLESGRHLLPTGDGSLTFVHVGRPLTWRWADGAALWLGTGPSRQPVPIIGACTVAITDPLVFHLAFSRATDFADEAHLQDVLDALVRDRLECRLGRTAGAAASTAAAAQSLLASLTACDLTESLADYGLACRHLAVYTRMAPVAEPVPSLAGHLPGPHDNSG